MTVRTLKGIGLGAAIGTGLGMALLWPLRGMPVALAAVQVEAGVLGGCLLVGGMVALVVAEKGGAK